MVTVQSHPVGGNTTLPVLCQTSLPGLSLNQHYLLRVQGPMSGLLQTPACCCGWPQDSVGHDKASNAPQHAWSVHPSLPMHSLTSSSMRPAPGLWALSRPSSSSVSSASISSAHDSEPPWTRAAKESASSSRDACKVWTQVAASTERRASYVTLYTHNQVRQVVRMSAVC